MINSGKRISTLCAISNQKEAKIIKGVKGMVLGGGVEK